MKTKQLSQADSRIVTWLNRYGKRCKDEDFGYDDCQMIDDCVFDTGANRDEVRAAVREYIREH